MDDISALSAIALEYDVPLHVDGCLGGFVAAFMPEAGHHIPTFDFRLPGVSSMSADTHKVPNFAILNHCHIENHDLYSNILKFLKIRRLKKKTTNCQFYQNDHDFKVVYTNYF